MLRVSSEEERKGYERKDGRLKRSSSRRSCCQLQTRQIQRNTVSFDSPTTTDLNSFTHSRATTKTQKWSQSQLSGGEKQGERGTSSRADPPSLTLFLLQLPLQSSVQRREKSHSDRSIGPSSRGISGPGCGESGPDGDRSRV